MLVLKKQCPNCQENIMFEIERVINGNGELVENAPTVACQTCGRHLTLQKYVQYVCVEAPR